MESSTKKVKIYPSHETKNKSNLAQPLSAQNVLTNEDVLKIVFSYLNSYDLCQVSKICRAWKQAAENEMLYRRAPEYVLKNCRLTGFKHTETSFDAKLLGKELRIKPTLGLVFEKCLKKTNYQVSGDYGHNLPTNCQTFVVGGYDIVSDVKSIDSHSSKGNAVGVFLPKFAPQIHRLYMNEEDPIRDQNADEASIRLKLQVDSYLPLEDTHTCIILLTDEEGLNFTNTVLNCIQKWYKPGTLSLWGGICPSLKSCNGTKDHSESENSLRWMMIKLSDPKLKSWSVVLPRSCKSKAQIEKKLEELKKNIELKKYSLGLMFACCARASSKEIEIEAFKKVFPQIPLAGLSGGGEIGLNTLSKEREPELQHEFTTVFLIITYDLSHEEAKIERSYGALT